MSDLSLLDVVIEDEKWHSITPEDLAAKCAAAAAAHVPAINAPASLLLTNDAAVRELNRQFRDKDLPTNVLSFPAGDGPQPEGGFLGDIALAYECCADEAERAGIPLGQHCAHLIVHGLLHLIGYDHQRESEARAMEKAEAAILASMGIADPYDDAAGVTNDE